MAAKRKTSARSSRRSPFSRRGNVMSIDFGGAGVVNVDLKAVRMTASQRKILHKLLRSRPTMTLEECTGDDCPAASRLSAQEFQAIRGLKAKLGTRGEPAGLICDFCLKCVKVPN